LDYRELFIQLFAKFPPTPEDILYVEDVWKRLSSNIPAIIYLKKRFIVGWSQLMKKQ